METKTNIPTYYLNKTTLNYIDAIASALGCSRDYAVTICFAIVGNAAGNKVKLVTNPYTNYANDYFCLVGGPSWNKTAPLKEISTPLRTFDKDNHKEFIKKKRQWERETKKEDDSEPPIFHQKIIGDSSSESRNAILAEGDSPIIIADELRTLIDSLGRYTKGGDGMAVEMSQLLSIWSNVGFTINRKSEDPKLIDEPVMSIIGGIQPGLLSKTLGRESFMESGFTQRFLFAFPHKSVFVEREKRLYLTEETRKNWSDLINNILRLEPIKLQLSLDAKKMYEAYADSNDIQASQEADEYIASVRQKMNIHVLRLAIMANLLSENWQEPLINESCMGYAIRVANHYLQTHIDRIYPLLIRTNSLSISKTEALRIVCEQFQLKSQSALADAICVSQQYVNKVVNSK